MRQLRPRLQASEAGNYKDRINVIKQMINLRKTEPLMKSRNFHFPNRISNSRVIEFMKVGWIDTYMEVIINCSEEDVEIPFEGEILFQRHYIDTTLLKNGILIRKIIEKQ